MDEKQPTALEYRHLVEVRFSDCDQYGHVNAAQFLDYVTSSRWAFLRDEYGMGLESFAEKGLGFFLTESTVRYKKQISGVSRVQVRSRTVSGTFTSMEVTFEILCEKGDILYSEGRMKLVVMDLEKGRPCRLPGWATGYFYQKSAQQLF